MVDVVKIPKLKSSVTMIQMNIPSDNKNLSVLHNTLFCFNSKNLHGSIFLHSIMKTLEYVLSDTDYVLGCPLCGEQNGKSIISVCTKSTKTSPLKVLVAFKKTCTKKALVLNFYKNIIDSLVYEAKYKKSDFEYFWNLFLSKLGEIKVLVICKDINKEKLTSKVKDIKAKSKSKGKFNEPEKVTCVESKQEIEFIKSSHKETIKKLYLLNKYDKPVLFHTSDKIYVQKGKGDRYKNDLKKKSDPKYSKKLVKKLYAAKCIIGDISEIKKL